MSHVYFESNKNSRSIDSDKIPCAQLCVYVYIYFFHGLLFEQTIKCYILSSFDLFFSINKRQYENISMTYVYRTFPIVNMSLTKIYIL
jgi:hypothetical protein